MQKTLKILINGIQYAIATDENEENIYQAAGLVDTLMKTQSGGQVASGRMGERTAVAVALQLATDLRKSRERIEAYEKRLYSLLQCLEGE